MGRGGFHDVLLHDSVKNDYVMPRLGCVQPVEK